MFYRKKLFSFDLFNLVSAAYLLCFVAEKHFSIKHAIIKRKKRKIIDKLVLKRERVSCTSGALSHYKKFSISCSFPLNAFNC
jgi:hypothetical protein